MWPLPPPLKNRKNPKKNTLKFTLFVILTKAQFIFPANANAVRILTPQIRDE